MGTAGNRKGYKVFSINTTIRNPQRNIDFLKVVANFDGFRLTTNNKLKIYHEFIKNGVYIPNNISNEIFDKIKNKIPLDDKEIYKIVNDNPQETGNNGRVMTQIRALKDLEFIALRGKRNQLILTITKLGREYINGEDVEIIYTKSLLGMHYGNINRKTVLNKARPFLNTIFILDYLNRYYEINDPESDFLKNGILFHEFGGFILSMKDCNYKIVADQIISYRREFTKKFNPDYFKSYFIGNGIISLKDETFTSEYPDEIIRKFSMTGLLEVHGRSKYSYIRFVGFNIIKIKQLISKYSDYKYEDFNNEADYEKYVSNVFIPWESSAVEKEEIINNQLAQIKSLDKTFELPPGIVGDERLRALDKKNSEFIFRDKVIEVEFKNIYRELLILSRELKTKSEYEETIPEPVRLEWLIALLFAKQYGHQFVKPSMRLNPDGTPKSFAGSGKADIVFEDRMHMYILEATMMSGSNQQENSETTSVSSHLKDYSINNKFNGALLVAPKIHNRVAKYFQFIFNVDQSFMLPVSIKLFSSVVENNKTIDSFTQNYKEIHSRLINSGSNVESFVDSVNQGAEGSFKDIIIEKEKDSVTGEEILSSYTGAMINLPLYESVGCGELMKAEIISEETIAVPKSYLSSGSKYFVLRVTGDSMNKAGINDGDLVLCVKNYHPEIGNKVVALIGDDATIKEYHNNGKVVTLKPRSDNPKHQPLVFTDNEEMKVLGVVVRVLDQEL